MSSDIASEAAPAGLSGHAFSSLFQAVTGLRNRRALVAMLGCTFVGVIVGGLLVAMTAIARRLRRPAGDDRLGRRDRHRRQRGRPAADGSRARHLAAQHRRRARLRADVHPEADRPRPHLPRRRDRGVHRPRGAALHLQDSVPRAAAVRRRLPALGRRRGRHDRRPRSCAWCCRCRRSGRARASRARWRRRSRSSGAVSSRRCCCSSSSASSASRSPRSSSACSASGLVPTLGMSMSIVGFGGFGVESMMAMSQGGGGSAGHAIAGAIGGALLWAVAASLVGQVYLLGLSLVYLRVTEGLDLDRLGRGAARDLRRRQAAHRRARREGAPGGAARRRRRGAAGAAVGARDAERREPRHRAGLQPAAGVQPAAGIRAGRGRRAERRRDHDDRIDAARRADRRSRHRAAVRRAGAAPTRAGGAVVRRSAGVDAAAGRAGAERRAPARRGAAAGADDVRAMPVAGRRPTTSSAASAATG